MKRIDVQCKKCGGIFKDVKIWIYKPSGYLAKIKAKKFPKNRHFTMGNILLNPTVICSCGGELKVI